MIQTRYLYRKSMKQTSTKREETLTKIVQTPETKLIVYCYISRDFRNDQIIEYKKRNLCSSKSD